MIDEHRSPIVFAYQGSCEFHNARVCDYSLNGMSFETYDEVIPGKAVTIKMVDYCAIFEGSVQWCRPLDNPGRPKFTVGILYDES